MTNIKVRANNILVHTDETFVAGCKRIYKYQLSFAPEWTGLDVTLHFRNGNDRVQVLPQVNEIPWEMVANTGMLYLTVKGTDGSGTVRLTKEKAIAVIEHSDDSESSEGTAPTPGLLAQMHALVNECVAADAARDASEQTRKAEHESAMHESQLATESMREATKAVMDALERGEFKGEKGARGDKGDKGDTGAQGEKGADGAKGDKGERGEPGEKGADGAKGDKGERGEQGEKGADGAKGDKGDPGAQGAKGDRGERGYSGLISKISVPYAPTIVVPANTMTEIATLTGAITITLGDGVDGYDNEWDFAIVQGETAQTITLPTVVWGMGIAPTFAANSATIVRLYYIGGTLRGEWCV